MTTKLQIRKLQEALLDYGVSYKLQEATDRILGIFEKKVRRGMVSRARKVSTKK